MTTTNFRSAALAVLAIGAGLASSSAFAQAPYAVSVDQPVVFAQPFAVEARNGAGHFTCGFNELHTRLQRQACGAHSVGYGAYGDRF